MKNEKKYKEAIEKEKSIHSLLKDNDGSKNFSFAETIEDERIRKEMIDFIQETIENVGESTNIWTMNNAKKWLAWLKKLSEQKSTDHPLANEKMEIERWKEACKAACSDRNYRSYYGLTETIDDYFVDGVQWADENPKQKPWNEEDEKRVNSIISSIEYCSEQYPDRKEYAKDIDWLKSLKPNHWKPSEEQMKGSEK